MKKLIALVPLIAVSLIGLSGCIYMQDSHTHRHGTTVSKEQAAQVEVGKTDKEWILKNLGTPDRVHADKDGLEVFEYISEKSIRSESRFIFLFSIESDSAPVRRVTRIVMRKGIVESITTQEA